MRVKPRSLNRPWTTAKTCWVKGTSSSGVSVARGMATSSIQAIGGVYTPNASQPHVQEGKSINADCKSRKRSANIMLNAISASGLPGRDPRRVFVQVEALPLPCSRSWNQVCWCMSWRNCLNAGAMSWHSAPVSFCSSCQSCEVSKWLASKMFARSSGCSPSEVTNTSSRRRWWKADLGSRKSVQDESRAALQTLPCTRRSWMPVIVCCAGKPPSCPMVLRSCIVGNNFLRVHEWGSSIITGALVFEKSAEMASFMIKGFDAHDERFVWSLPQAVIFDVC